MDVLTFNISTDIVANLYLNKAQVEAVQLKLTLKIIEVQETRRESSNSIQQQE